MGILGKKSKKIVVSDQSLLFSGFVTIAQNMVSKFTKYSQNNSLNISDGIMAYKICLDLIWSELVFAAKTLMNDPERLSVAHDYAIEMFVPAEMKPVFDRSQYE